ncbi:MAG: sugar ABC transporter permease [Clostridiales bacterium]|nr:sugar ABC transporter permease [Clostridiales bacterium]
MNKRSFVQGFQRHRISYMMLAPYLTLFIIFTVIPVFYAMFLSFTSFNLFEAPRFIALDNYRSLFLHDDVFMKALTNTMVIAVITGPLSYAACFLLAWLITDFKPFPRAVLTTIFYVPSISGAVFMIWSIMFSSDNYGYINSVLVNMGILNDPIQWLEDGQYVLAVVIIVSLWLSLGTSFLSFIAGLQNVDHSLYEAGSVDGITNRWQELWYITLPSMRPQLMFGAVMQITAAFGAGDVSARLAGLPSVDYAAHTIVNHITDYGYTRFEMGYASAIAVILFIMQVVSNKLVQKMLRKVGT